MPRYENPLTRDCAGCQYLSTYIGSCDYILIEGKRRPCPGGKGCTVKKIGPKLPPEDMGKKPKWDYFTAKRLWMEGKSDREIAEAVGTTRDNVAAYRRKNWGKTKAEKKTIQRVNKTGVVWDKAKGKEMYLAGASDSEIAAAMGISRKTVKSYRAAKWGHANIKSEDQQQRGVKVAWDTELAKRLWLEGKIDREIAEAVGTTANAVGDYRRRHWGYKGGNDEIKEREE